MRIIAGICIFFSLFLAPWWWTSVLIICGTLVFKTYPEAYIFFSFMLMYMYPQLAFLERLYVFGAVCLAWMAWTYIVHRIAAGDNHTLYA